VDGKDRGRSSQNDRISGEGRNKKAAEAAASKMFRTFTW
jgi:hypothetical protein